MRPRHFYISGCTMQHFAVQMIGPISSAPRCKRFMMNFAWRWGQMHQRDKNSKPVILFFLYGSIDFIFQWIQKIARKLFLQEHLEQNFFVIIQFIMPSWLKERSTVLFPRRYYKQLHVAIVKMEREEITRMPLMSDWSNVGFAKACG